MLRGKYLAGRMKWFAVFLLLLAVIQFLLLGMELTRWKLMSRILMVFLLMYFLILMYLGYRWLYLPIKANSRIKTRFLKSQVFDDFFHMQCPFSKEDEAVLAMLEEMLDRNNMVAIAQKESEYLALQNQINPHFLYNTLESIRAEALIAGEEQIAEMTEALATFFRYTISKVGHLVTLDDELSNIENYYFIQRYRFGDRISLQISYDSGTEDGEDILMYRIPKLSIQPIVENAIYHGLEKKMGGGLLKIRIQTTDSHLVIMVSDNGIGMDEARLEEVNRKLACLYPSQDESRRKGGIALQNVNSRIRLLFGDGYGIKVYSRPGAGTDVEMIMPLVREERADGAGENV